MDLGLDVRELTKPGRRVAAIGGSVVRELVPSDLEALGEAGHTGAVELKRLSDRHHALARMLALGEPMSVVCSALGYTPSRVSVLKASPAFQELLALYQDEKEAGFADFVSRAAGLATDAVSVLQDRLEEQPEDVSTNALVEIVKMAADRSGNGPTSTQNTNVSLDLGERLRAARERARAAQVIDAEVVEESQAHEQ